MQRYSENKKKNISYSDTGVDISEGQNFVEKIKSLAQKTMNSRVLTGIGPFGLQAILLVALRGS